MKCAIYCRVSTEGQELKQQIESCKKYCEIKRWENYDIFTEIQSTRKQRPVLQNLLKQCRQGKYDTIIVFRLDRAWRSSRQFIMDFDSLSARGCNVISVMEGLDPTTPIGKAMMTILVALAELERENISLATKQRLEALKNLGKHVGRPKGSKDKKKRSSVGYHGNKNRSKKGGVKNRKKSYQESR
jgi:site-specific DNA recombinase